MIALLWTLLACAPTPDAHDGHDGHDDHDEVVEEGVVTLAPEAVAAAGLVVAPATTGRLGGTLDLPARVVLPPRQQALVSPWIAGQVDAIAVHPGDDVRKGQVLAQVQSPELGEAVAAFHTARARDQAADARLERLARLEADGVASRAQVLEAEADHAEAEGALEAAEERLRILDVPMDVGDVHAGEHFPSRVPVRSPIAGTVLEASATVGERVAPGQALFRVGDLDEVWLLLDVYARDLATVREGQTVAFSVEAWPGERFEGTVARVGDWVEPEARTVEVRVVLPNADHRLKPNLFATAHLDLGQAEGPQGIVLPAEAVRSHDGATVVFVEDRPHRFVRREVAVAEEGPGGVRLADGVADGERVVVEGAFVLASELDKAELGHGHAH